MTYSKHLPVKDKFNNLKKIGFSYTATAETVSNAAVSWSKSKIKITVITIAVTFLLVALSVGLALGLRRSSSEQNEPSQFTPPPFDSKSIPTKYRAPKSFKMPEPLFPNATHSCENSLRLGLVGFMGKGKSTLVNILGGIYVRGKNISDIAKSSAGIKSTTLDTYLYKVQSFGYNISIADTRGLETDRDVTAGIINETVYSISELMPEGLDSILILDDCERADSSMVANFLNFILGLVSPSAFPRVIFVLTHSEMIPEREEAEYIDKFKQKYLSNLKYPSAKKAGVLFANASYVFSRANGHGQIFSAEARMISGRNILLAAHKICKSNNGKPYNRLKELQILRENQLKEIRQIEVSISSVRASIDLFRNTKFNPGISQSTAQCRQSIDQIRMSNLKLRIEYEDATDEDYLFEMRNVSDFAVKSTACISTSINLQKEHDEEIGRLLNHITTYMNGINRYVMAVNEFRSKSRQTSTNDVPIGTNLNHKRHQNLDANMAKNFQLDHLKNLRNDVLRDLREVTEKSEKIERETKSIREENHSCSRGAVECYENEQPYTFALCRWTLFNGCYKHPYQYQPRDNFVETFRMI